MKKLVIIGIDGLDREYLSDHLDELPTFRRIFAQSPKIISMSVFPPDSDTAWATIYTGLNPAKHGVIDFVDPLARNKIAKNESDYSYTECFREKTFWDVLSKNDKRVCVIYPHMVNPVWQVNGFIISYNPKTETLQYLPSYYKFGFSIDNYQVTKRIPRTKLEFKKYLNKKRETVINEFNFAKKMFQNENWDLFFFYTSALDSTMHIFWNYCDKDDPTYPGPNQFQNSIKDFHILHDKLINEFLEKVDKDTTVLIISDHGHSMRPTKLVNINELLRQNGFLMIKEGVEVPIYSLKEKFKRISVNIAQRSGLRPAAQTILRMFPGIKKMYTNPSMIDFNKTLAHCTDLSGMKAYSYGGIKVYREKFSCDEDFIKAKKLIISQLESLTLPDSTQTVFEWIKLREDVYSGDHINKYPEILFQLVEGYGAGWNVKGDVWEKSLSHKFFPGSHRGSTPVFIVNNYSGPVRKNEVQLEDIYPSILTFFNIFAGNKDIDGSSIF